MRTKPISIFDGFCDRPYREEIDGWRMEQPEEFDYPAVTQARAVLEMYDEIRELRKENWTLRKENKFLKESCDHHYNSVLGNLGTCLTAALNAAEAEETRE